MRVVDLIVHGEQLMVGVVTPHTAPGPEVELPALSRGRVVTLIARTRTPPYASGRPPQPFASGVAGLRALSMPAVLDLATANFRNRSIDVIAHASTTSSYVLGRRAETALAEHIARRCNVPVVASGAAAAAGLRACAVQRVQLIHPPWFDDVFDALGVTYFGDHGFEAWVSRARSLPGDPAHVTPEHIVQWVVTHASDRAEAIFLAGTGFRTANAIDELERRTGRTVIGANQALLREILTVTNTAQTINGYGRLLRTD
jgi:maleate isomerase